MSSLNTQSDNDDTNFCTSLYVTTNSASSKTSMRRALGDHRRGHVEDRQHKQSSVGLGQNRFNFGFLIMVIAQAATLVILA